MTVYASKWFEGHTFMQTTHPDEGISPYSKARIWLFRWWDVPHWKNRVCTLFDGMRPHSEVLSQMCLRAFLRNLIGTEILCYGIFPARKPDSVAGISPLRAPTSQLPDGLYPRSEANSNLILFRDFSLLEA